MVVGPEHSFFKRNYLGDDRKMVSSKERAAMVRSLLDSNDERESDAMQFLLEWVSNVQGEVEADAHRT